MFGELGFVTRSNNLIPTLRQANRATAISDVTVLIDGETGTGKQVLAHAIHQLDQKRGSHAFVTAHCGTISESIAESELFGHRRGAFTGAMADRPGLFQVAHRGTLFLDESNRLWTACVRVDKILESQDTIDYRPKVTHRLGITFSS